MAKAKFSIESNGSGMRYVKRFKKQRFRSPTYAHETRENERESWRLFLTWKATIEATEVIPRRLKELRSELLEMQSELAHGQDPEQTEQIQGEIEATQDEIDSRLIAYQQGIDFDKREQENRDNQIIAEMLPLEQLPIKVRNKILNREIIGEPIPTDKSVSYWKEKYFKVTQSEEKTAKAKANLCRDVMRYVTYLGKGATTDKIDSTSWENFCLEIRSSKFKSSTEKYIIGRCRAFLIYLSQHDIIELPKNINTFKTTIEAKEIEHYSLSEMNYILNNSEGYLKCFVHLFMNCGMQTKDVADLKPDELHGEYITRPRSKKKPGEKPPLATWKLWPETLNLIQQYRSDKNGLLFTMPKTNRKWYHSEPHPTDPTKTKEYKPISKLWYRFQKQYPQRLPLIKLRHSSANYLPAETNQLSSQIYFLGQVPSGVASVNYVKPEQHDFDKSVMGLRHRILSAT